LLSRLFKSQKGYIIFLKDSAEIMRLDSPALICPEEDNIRVTVGSTLNRDAKKHQERFNKGSSKVVSVRKKLMDAITEGMCQLTFGLLPRPFDVLFDALCRFDNCR
jgi:hypothetical protein